MKLQHEGVRTASSMRQELDRERRATTGQDGEALDDAARFRRDVATGLAAQQKSIPCKWLYNARGSELFEKICETPEYYVTRTEISLLEEVCQPVAQAIGPEADVLEPGSGAGVKIRLLLDALERPRTFVPIDISDSAVAQSVESLQKDYRDLHIVPVVADFTKGIHLPASLTESAGGRRVIFFPGSTISNFSSSEARSLLHHFRELLRPGDFLFIGVDLVKDPEVLLAAYDDAQGVTAAFNLNLLNRIQEELAPELDVTSFEHRAVYREELSRIEMHLVSKSDQSVTVAGQEIRFSPGESIHTENSYKYTIDGFRELASAAGFTEGETFTDAHQYFSLHLLRAD